MSRARTPRVVVVMGVAGAGKSTVGRALAASLGWSFLEGDEHHPPANLARMAAGLPLDDAARAPWLATLRALLGRALRDDRPAVLACSALRERYREALVPDGSAPGDVAFVHLHVPEPELRRRLATRRGHFAGPPLLPSQLGALEPSATAVTVDGTRPLAELVGDIRAALGLDAPAHGA